MPHIRRMPDRIIRDEFAADAAQKLGIDSALVREELRQAARKRRTRSDRCWGSVSMRRRECCFGQPPLQPGSRVFLCAGGGVGVASLRNL